jgi:hypothetical protein
MLSLLLLLLPRLFDKLNRDRPLIAYVHFDVHTEPKVIVVARLALVALLQRGVQRLTRRILTGQAMRAQRLGQCLIHVSIVVKVKRRGRRWHILGRLVVVLRRRHRERRIRTLTISDVVRVGRRAGRIVAMRSDRFRPQRQRLDLYLGSFHL